MRNLGCFINFKYHKVYCSWDLSEERTFFVFISDYIQYSTSFMDFHQEAAFIVYKFMGTKSFFISKVHRKYTLFTYCLLLILPQTLFPCLKTSPLYQNSFFIFSLHHEGKRKCSCTSLLWNYPPSVPLHNLQAVASSTIISMLNPSQSLCHYPNYALMCFSVLV